MGPRQKAGTDRYWPDGASIAPIDARFAVQNLRAHDSRFQRKTSLLHRLGIRTFLILDAEFGKDFCPDAVYGLGPYLLLLLAEKGDAILVSVDRKEFKELGRFKALEGKTWNLSYHVVDRRFETGFGLLGNIVGQLP